MNRLEGISRRRLRWVASVEVDGPFRRDRQLKTPSLAAAARARMTQQDFATFVYTCRVHSCVQWMKTLL
ncbi:hypothetical protein OUZ56_007161 [Daphnia magna]|uniref:Uncharacterized protein n=1 Tax=Daphnia magna TaxID=35525 RepID=A0ABQ9YXS2_9CRUS|nr:hypothetical protein OUZ56_007161 [Daphnia magna]